MEENRTRSAMEDLRVIRGVLDQSATSLRGLAPLFWRMGLVCALVLLWIEGGDLLCYLFPVLDLSGGTVLYLALIVGSLLLALVQYILPPAALMATARRIKKLEKGG